VSEKFQVANLSEMEIPYSSSGVKWAPVRRDLDVGSFGINAYTGDAGMDVINEHDEVGPDARRHEELYFVVKGRATFTVDGEAIDAPAGTFVFVRDPAAKRKAVAEEEPTTIVVVGGRPGEVYTPPRWERSAPALGYFATKEYEKAYEVLMQTHEEFPDDATVLYNLACAESLLGGTDNAIAHLEQSIANGERFRELAQTDTDFDAIRDDARFKELVGPPADESRPPGA
jgi:mannose-6-phosphate isomerase-like protein (cupin superfamily)